MPGRAMGCSFLPEGGILIKASLISGMEAETARALITVFTEKHLLVALSFTQVADNLMIGIWLKLGFGRIGTCTIVTL